MTHLLGIEQQILVPHDQPRRLHVDVRSIPFAPQVHERIVRVLFVLLLGARAVEGGVGDIGSGRAGRKWTK